MERKEGAGAGALPLAPEEVEGVVVEVRLPTEQEAVAAVGALLQTRRWSLRSLQVPLAVLGAEAEE